LPTVAVLNRARRNICKQVRHVRSPTALERGFVLGKSRPPAPARGGWQSPPERRGRSSPDRTLGDVHPITATPTNRVVFLADYDWPACPMPACAHNALGQTVLRSDQSREPLDCAGVCALAIRHRRCRHCHAMTGRGVRWTRRGPVATPARNARVLPCRIKQCNSSSGKSSPTRDFARGSSTGRPRRYRRCATWDSS
jgi:hypothetical protein